MYLYAHHPDILASLTLRRENADEKICIKTLSLGVVIPDVTFQLAKDNRDMHLFSPYDVQREYGTPLSDLSVSDHYDELVANPRIRKNVVSAREFFKTLAELQFESGYPYVLFEDTVNRANPLAGQALTCPTSAPRSCRPTRLRTYDSAIGYLRKSAEDISCNLGSLNIAQAMNSSNLGSTVETAVRALTSVSDQTNVDAVPSVANGNETSHAIGLGQMNLDGYLASQRIHYGSEEGIDFTDIYFLTITYHAIRASNQIAIERGKTFAGFEDSTYADGSDFDNTEHYWLPATQRVRELFADAGVTIPFPRGLGTATRVGETARNLQRLPAGRPAHRFDLVCEQRDRFDPPGHGEDRDPQGGQARPRLTTRPRT